VRAVVIDGAGGNFCSGGDVHEIIGPLTKMDEKGLLEFTRMTGRPRAARCAPARSRSSPRSTASARGGRDDRAGSRLRYATPAAKTAFLFVASASRAATWAPARCCRA
jgi:enoyl-CoA hydratase/carnithine racemase